MRRSDQRPRSHTFLKSCDKKKREADTHVVNRVSGTQQTGQSSGSTGEGPHLHGGVAGAHHTSTGGVHLGQVVEGQDVACLRGQVEELECLLVIALHADAAWGNGRKKRNRQSIQWEEKKSIPDLKKI